MIERLFAADAVSGKRPVAGERPRFDRGGLVAHYRERHEAFPDTPAESDALLADGETVAVWTTVRGTHEGPIHGVGQTGRASRRTASRCVGSVTAGSATDG